MHKSSNTFVQNNKGQRVNDDIANVNVTAYVKASTVRFFNRSLNLCCNDAVNMCSLKIFTFKTADYDSCPSICPSSHIPDS